MFKVILHRILVLLSVAFLSVLLTACPGGGAAIQDAPATTDSGTAISSGYIILNGLLLNAPYLVGTDAVSITINGTQALSYAAPPAPEPMVYDQAASDLDAFQLVDLARLTYLQAGGGDAGVQAVVARIKAHPAATTIQVEDVSPATEIRITDKTGLTVKFKTAAPDSEGRNFTDAERAVFATEMAALWREHLADSGGLVISSTGNMQWIPAAEIGSLITATDQAFSAPTEERPATLLGLYEDETIVDEIIARYVPRGTLSGAAPARQALAPQSNVSSPRRIPASAQRIAGCCKTPGSPKAWIYRTLAGDDHASYIAALRKEGYRINTVDFHGRAQPPGSGWGAFLRTSQSGVVYFVTHSSATGISLQSFARGADASTALARVKARYDAGDIAWWQESNGTWWMDATPQGISNHWQSNDTIVHAASCYSITLAESFAAREYFGYTGITSALVAKPHTDKLWRRLTGNDPGDGSLRQVTAAYDSGTGYAPALWMHGIFGSVPTTRWLHDDTWSPSGDPDGNIWANSSGANRHHVSTFAHRDGSPDGDTVISPSVAQVTTPEQLYAGTQGAVVVGFDAEMDTSVSPNLAIEISGCAKPAGEPYWQFGSILSLPVVATASGTATVTVNARHARSPAPIYLDGNQNQDTGVAPNRDNYIFTFTCLASYVPPPQTGLNFNLAYAAGSGGSLHGNATQSVTEGGSGSKVTAVPNDGYRFVRWSDGVTAAARTDSNVQSNMSVTAIFEPIPYFNLVYTAGTGGSIQGSSAQSVADGGSGSQVTAIPNTGYRFVKWADGVSTAARIDSEVRSNIDVQAIFEPITDVVTPATQISIGSPVTCIRHGIGISTIGWSFPINVTGSTYPPGFTMEVMRPDSTKAYINTTFNIGLLKMALDIYTYGNYSWQITLPGSQGAELTGTTTGTVNVGPSEQNVGQCD